MTVKKIAQHIYEVSLGFVNVFLIDAEELTLIDAGIPGSEKKILPALSELGYQPHDLRHILVTHLHVDHVGGLEQMQKASGAQVTMHYLDSAAYRAGEARKVEPAPGLINRIIVHNINKQRSTPPVSTANIDHEIREDTEIPGTGGMRAIHTPGHTAGHIVYYWPKDKGILFLGDTASNMLHLGYSFLYENFAQGKQTLGKIAQMDFETACFSHGKAILSGAGEKFQKTFRAA
jgi:glyoxylase-like metal-dependent hydrolase (beta-lactamase superfamily II)